MKSSLKILHAPTTVGGNPQSLSRAEKKLGHHSYNITLEQNYLAYDVDEVIFVSKKSIVKNEIKRWKEIFKSLKNYDILHYNAGRSIAPIRAYPLTNTYSKWKVFLFSGVYSRVTEFLDLKIARYLKRVTAVTYQGSDARQNDYCLENYPIHFVHELENNDKVKQSDVLKRHRIKTVDKYADLIYAVNPDLMNVLPKRTRFTPYATVDLDDWKPVSTQKNPDIPHIVHAPSNRAVKGTKYIIDAFERLEKEGIPFRYTLVENMSNKQAREVYETADILIDQLLAGYYGGLAVELMALGKPVVCYMRESDMHHLPTGMWNDCPIINATPDDLYDVLKQWLTTRKNDIASQGKKSRDYVERWHDPVKIATQIIQDYHEVYNNKLK